MTVKVSNNILYNDSSYQNNAPITTGETVGSGGENVFETKSTASLRFKRAAVSGLGAILSNTNMIIIQGNNLLSPPGPPGPPGGPGAPGAPVSGPGPGK